MMGLERWLRGLTTGCSWRASLFVSRHLYGISHSSVNSSSSGSVSFSGLWGDHVHTVPKHMQAQNSYTEINKSFLRRRVGSVVVYFLFLQMTWVHFPALIRWPTNICNSNSRGSDTLSWTLRTPVTYKVYINSCSQSSLTHKIKSEKIKI